MVGWNGRYLLMHFLILLLGWKAFNTKKQNKTEKHIFIALLYSFLAFVTFNNTSLPFTFAFPDTVKIFQKMAETENMAILLLSISIPMNSSPIEDFILNTEPSVTQRVSEYTHTLKGAHWNHFWQTMHVQINLPFCLFLRVIFRMLLCI